MSAGRVTRTTRGERGETLTETLVAILVCTLASIILLTSVVSASNINRSTQQRDEAMKTEESVSSTLSSSTGSGDKVSGTVTFSANGTSSTYGTYYSKGDDIVSYVDSNQ